MRFSSLANLFLVGLISACSSASDETTTAPPGPTPESQPPPSEAEPPAPNKLAVDVEAFFTKAEKDGTFTGSVVAVDGGKVVLEKAFGPADRAKKRPNAKDTIYRIGSVTKQFTASAILALAEDGKLSVDDPVSKYFPEYPKTNLTFDGVEPTLHHLLSHTSGIADGRSTEWFKDHVWFTKIDPKEYLAEAAKLPMKRKPGASFEYNNWAYYLLGLVVERVSGKPYETFMKERFFTPLGMTDTGTILPADKRERTAHGYQEKNGKFSTLDDDPLFADRDLTFAFGSGQIFSTVSDLAKWDRALAARTALPKLEDQLFKPNLDDYGYGWVMETSGGVAVQWHNGAISPLGFTALVVRVPAKDRFVAYLANLDTDIVSVLEQDVIALAAK
jgi:CubicO group peptidase (beta-lactamase class C family)